MHRFTVDSDARRLGEALAALRREAGLSQAEAGARLGMTSQGWGLYEAGRRSGLFRPDVQRRLTQAVGATVEALALRAAGPLPTASDADPSPANPVQDRGRDFSPAPSPQTSPGHRRLRLSDDALAPWAASGVEVEYVPDRWPRRGQGCVVERTDGSVCVRLYDGADAETVHLTGVGSPVERMARSDIRRLSAVIARWDET